MTTFLINIITLSRILLAVIIFILLMSNDNYEIALLLFIVAGLTDYFDGYLARKFSLESQLGEILDPISDKILILFILFGLAINLSSYLIGFFGSLILTREMWVSALRDLNSRNSNLEATKVIFLAKVKTAAQLFTIFVYLTALAFNQMLLIILGDILIIGSAIITVYTGYIYTLNTFK